MRECTTFVQISSDSIYRVSYFRLCDKLEKAKDEEQMDFSEALAYAVDKRKFIIIHRSAKKSVQVDEEEEELE